MRMCSDLVFNYLKNIGIDSVFTLVGGGIMYLVESLGNSGIGYICCHHEQTASVAAQAYGMVNGKLGVCLVTTGPGGTNALTGAAAAYMDSTPVLFLTGQVKRADFASKRGVRQYGAQENDIISMAKPITKYAVCITEESEAIYELEKAVYIATHGRKGPVWVDIPLDIQSSMLDETTIKHFNPYKQVMPVEADKAAAFTLSKLKDAKRPLVLVGHGVGSARAEQALSDLVHHLNIPVMTTWREVSLFDFDDELFFGSPGLQAPRYSNMILQSCDVLIVLGSRLDNMITAFNEPNFAQNAEKIIIDIDENELKKFNIPNTTTFNLDVGTLINILSNLIENESPIPVEKWLNACKCIKKRFPIWNEKQIKDEGVNLYGVSLAISENCAKDDVIVISSTSRCNTAGHIAFKYKAGQKTVSSMGLGSMGFALPSVIGAYYAQENGKIVMLEGDGSLQLNIQELQTIVSHKIPVKMFIFNNDGYGAIATMQDRNFAGHHVGSTRHSGLYMPNMKKIAAAYDIPYRQITDDSQITEVVGAVMSTEGYIICEVFGSMVFDEIPKCISHLNEQGVRVSAALEAPFPFLPSEEVDAVIKELTGSNA